MEVYSDEDLIESTANERSIEFIASIGEYPDTFHGRGIVMCGGGLRYFTNAWVSISVLRHVGCRLPVQLWYLGRHEIDEHMEELIAPLGVECIDATAVRAVHPARILRGWEVKAYAILHCPYREVLLLDADNCVASNPEALFDSWEYRDAGALFWPDLGRFHANHSSWRVFGVPYRDEPEIESGQIVVNKETCWKALSLTKYYNDYSDFYYRYVHGDKETFHFAFRKVEQPYAMPARPTRFEHGVFFQSDFAGETMFQHRVGAKWDLHGENPFIEDCRFEAEGHRFLEHLRVVWDGQIGRPRAGATHEDLAAVRGELTSRIYRLSSDDGVASLRTHRAISFASNGRVGLGAGPSERTWKVYVSDRGVALELGTMERATHVLLRKSETQNWKSLTGNTQLVPIPRKTAATRHPTLSLTEFVEKVELYAGTFAWHQYAMAREMAQGTAVIVGPIDSAAALIVARGMHDRGGGEVILIDTQPRENDALATATQWFELFGTANRIRYVNASVHDALVTVRERIAATQTRLVVVDRMYERNDELAAFASVFALVDRGAALLRSRSAHEWRLVPLASGELTLDPERGLVIDDRATMDGDCMRDVS
jgi:putative mannosyltransferase